MLRVLKNRFEQGYKTSKYPYEKIVLPERFRGRPLINKNCAKEIILECIKSCPQSAICDKNFSIDMGKCVFCGTCEEISNGEFVKFSNNFELAATKKEHLITDGTIYDLKQNLDLKFKKLFGRSLQLRQVSAGGCNACEADVNVLNTPFFDLSRFGINFVASPRHADGILVTGPIPKNMKTALLETYEAIPEPKMVIAVGACAISHGPFYKSKEIVEPLDTLLPVSLYVPGCPPHPITTLHALLTYFK
ncbi:MAG: hydrogenase [Desulfobacterales bacterium]|nr:hydrogenase [Desulfobacterales bacterium]MBF0398830.1 hydrogenase [Desulfobacterales bacterium]